MNIPEQALEAARKYLADRFFWDDPILTDVARELLEAAAPYLMAAILEDCADTAETDELTTAAEVIYDLRRHAKDLRPRHAV